MTNQSAILNDNNTMRVVIDLQQRYFQHAILIVDDFRNGDAFNVVDYSDYIYLQNLQVYVGDDPDNYLNNNLCPGGPYLDINDTSNWLYEPSTFNWTFNSVWKWGAEIWCNREGRYTHIVGDLSHQEGQTFI